ncbi:MAG: BamA/TamA family outer membrane protein [Candidatus Krumholzibacteria bacterium]|nr:BamA/TamA family outer membrane protein [Candidatus Krumholzibacteria bacterium]
MPHSPAVSSKRARPSYTGSQRDPERTPRSLPRRRQGLLLACLTLAATAAAQRVPAPAPIDVQNLARWQGREVTELSMPGCPPHLLDTARNGLALAPRRRLLGRRLATLTMRAATADTRRLQLLLARHGYPAATITASGIADGASGVKLAFAVTVGPVVRYGTIAVTGWPPELAAAADTVRATLPAGDRFDEPAVQRARQELLRALRHAGYARPQVNISVTRRDPTTGDVEFACRAGRRFVYDELKVAGAPDDLVPLVRRTVSLAPGTPYSPQIVADSRRHLRQLELFRQVRLHAEPRDSATVDLMADLRPRAMLTTEASVGTFTDNWLVVKGGVTHRNFWRRGRGLFAGASYATFRRDAELRTCWPGLITARSRTEARLVYEIQDENSYRLDKTELALSNLFTAWRHTSLRLGVVVSHGRLADRSADPDAFAAEVGLQTLLHGIWYRDTSDNPLAPGRGHRLTLQAEWSPPGFWTRAPFSSLRAFGSQYLPLGPDRVLALRLDGAVAWPLGDAADLRPDRRWFAGGTSSMRGYRRRQLGPLDSDLNPIGGEVRVLASAEARWPVWSIFGAALFVDSGQVWRRLADVDARDLETAAGLGLLIGTPVGPVRLDVAHNLTVPEPGQPRTLLQFGIGHPF